MYTYLIYIFFGDQRKLSIHSLQMLTFPLIIVYYCYNGIFKKHCKGKLSILSLQSILCKLSKPSKQTISSVYNWNCLFTFILTYVLLKIIK